MNGSKSPAPAVQVSDNGKSIDGVASSATGLETQEKNEEEQTTATTVAQSDSSKAASTVTPVTENSNEPTALNATDADAESEAETLIESPVKKREAAKQAAAASATTTVIKTENAPRSRIGSLPVPQEDDEDGPSTAAASPMPSTEINTHNGTKEEDAPADGDGDADVEMADNPSDLDAEGSDDDDLSSADSSSESSSSDNSSPSRAASENPEKVRGGAGSSASPNPRKRKHRASSVDHLTSNKRRSMDPPTSRRRLRGMHSEDAHSLQTLNRSSSPKSRGHRRAVSTQSALDGALDASSHRSRRRANHTFPPLREAKSAKSTEGDSDASSETTSRGGQQDDANSKRPQRGIGRSTSTPGGVGGRSVASASGRDHKRHVNKYGFTRLAEACENNDLDLVKEWRERDPAQLEQAEFAGNKPLQIASLNGNAEVVAYLIECGAQTDCANVDKDTPLIDAAENGHLEVVRLLLGAGVDPLRQNVRGQQALDVITDETDEAKAIRAALHEAIDTWNSSAAKQRREEEAEEHRHRVGPSKELHFMARTYENLLKLVQNNDRPSVSEFLAARVPVDNTIIAAAARTGDTYLVNMLLAEMDAKKVNQKAEKPVLAVLGTSHYEMLVMLTELEQFQPLWRSRGGKSWAEIAEERMGPLWRQEKDLFLRLEERAGGAAATSRRSSSPVAKREGGGRRKMLVHSRSVGDEDADADGSDDAEDAHDGKDTASAATLGGRKKKHGRRLMSRKALRNAKGAAMAESDEDSDDSSVEAEPMRARPTEDGSSNGGQSEINADVSKLPDTPNTRRTLRSESQSASPEMTPRTLRKKRSASFREPAAPEVAGVVGLGLDTVSEEDARVARESQEIEAQVTREAKEAENKVAQEASDAEVKAGREAREAEAKRVLELALEADAKRKAAESAAAEIKRAEAEAARVAQAAVEAKNARKAEEKRVENERRAEEARVAETERLRVELEFEKEKRAYREAVLQELPQGLRQIFDPESGFHFRAGGHLEDRPERLREEQEWVLQHHTPLRLFRDDLKEAFDDTDTWILNLQAAPYLGKKGLELFFDQQCPYYTESLTAHWATSELSEKEWEEVRHQLASAASHDVLTPEPNDDDLDVGALQARVIARRLQSAETVARLRDPHSRVRICKVRLADFWAHLDGLLAGLQIPLEFVGRVSQSKRQEIFARLQETGTTAFVDCMKRFWGLEEGGPFADGRPAVGKSYARKFGCVDMVDVRVVHEK